MVMVCASKWVREEKDGNKKGAELVAVMREKGCVYIVEAKWKAINRRKMLKSMGFGTVLLTPMCITCFTCL